MKPKLTIELIPKTSWYSNVRSNVNEEEWDIIRKKCYANANFKCEICGSTGQFQGYKYSVECHEIWEYDDVNHNQKLIGLIALCPHCHKTKHVGLAKINNELNVVINQLMVVNNMNKEEAINCIDDAFKVWSNRSQHKWLLDITYLSEYLK